MAQIKAKQVKLVAQGDLILGDVSANGSILSVGAANQIILSSGTTAAWGFLGQLRDTSGAIVVDTTTTGSQVNNLTISGAPTTDGPIIAATGTDTNIDINLVIKGSGEVLVPVSYVVISDNALTTKTYVDSVATGLDFKNSVRAATTTDLFSINATFAYNNGDPGTWTAPTGGFVIDGITIVDGDRILVKDETGANRRGNALWRYDDTTDELIRTTDADNTPSNEVSGGLFCFIEEGAIQADTGWVMSSPDGPATLGTDVLLFTQFSAAGISTAGPGLTKTGNDFAVNVDNITIAIDGTNDVVVGHDDSTDHTNQVLFGQDATGGQATALWAYVEDLRGSSSGDLIIDGVDAGSAVNHLRITNAATGTDVLIETIGTDTNIDLAVTAKGTGRIILDGNSMPNGPSPVRTVFAIQGTDSAGDISAVTSTTGADRVLIFDDSANTIIWELASAVGVTDVYVSITDGVATENATGSSTITFTSSEGVDLAVSAVDTVTAALDFSAGLVTENTIDTVNDVVAFYDNSAGIHRKTSVGNLFGSAGFSFGQIDLTGNTSGDLNVDAEQANDALTLDGGIGITLTGTAASDTVSIAFTRSGMADTAVTLTDTVPFFDDSNTEEPEYRSFGDIFEDLDVPVGISATGIIVKVSSGPDVWAGRTIEASVVHDELGIIITNGDGIAGNPTVGLDIVGLVTENTIDSANDLIVFYDASTTFNRKTTIDEMLTDAGVGVDAEDDVSASGGPDEALSLFFTNTPISDASITVYFNGLSLRSTGWTRSGTTLTMVDSVNGYSTESGDIISAGYAF